MNRPAPELLEREVPAPDHASLPALIRAEIDGQIATARAFPRSIRRFMDEATEMVCLDEEMAAACIYALPRKKDGRNVTIEGPSARFAELIQHAFCNNRGGARVVAEDDGFVTAQGTYHDLEKNVQVVMEVKRRITDKNNRKFNADMVGVTGNAACAIAHRNAVLKGIPKAFWQPIYQRARAVVVGDITTLSAKRKQALDWFQKVGIDEARVCAGLGVAGPEDIGLDELATLAGIKTAIKEGLAPESAFADEPESTVRAATNVTNMAEVAAGLAARRAPAQPEPLKNTDEPAGYVCSECMARSDADEHCTACGAER